MEPIESTVTANQLRHHLLTWDGGGDTLVLCLHGFLDSAWGFAPIGPLLAAAGHRVVAADLRGHGDTDRAAAGHSYLFFDYLFDVAELVAALAPRRLFVVGHSMGSAIAALYAGTFPERVERLALLEGLAMPEGPVELGPPLVGAWIEQVQRARKRAPRAYPDLAAAAAAIRRNDPLCPEPVARLLAERGTRPVPGGLVFKHDPVHLAPSPYPYRHEAIRPFWERVACPTLVIYGERSEFPQPEDMAERLSAFRTLRRVTIPGAGHMMIRHAPQAVANELLRFFAGNG